MMDQTPNNTFVGMGSAHSADTPDIPLGLGMALSQDVEAMSSFGRMSAEEKKQMIAFVQGATTGDDAKARIQQAVAQVKAGINRFS